MSVTYIGHTDDYTVCVTVVVIRPIKMNDVRYVESTSARQIILGFFNGLYLADCLIRDLVRDLTNSITVCLISAPVRKDGKVHHAGRQ